MDCKGYSKDMIYDAIRNYFGQMNFALVSTTGATFSVVTNRVGDEPIYCVLVDNTATTLSASNILSIQSQIVALSVKEENILFIVITDNVQRDRQLSQLAGINLWLVDANDGNLLIYENQPEDFYGLKRGIMASVETTDTVRLKRVRNKSTWPWVTIILIAINIIVFVITALMGDVSDARFMLSVGADFAPYVFFEGQVWRLFTCMFLHFGIRHLAGNMVCLGLYGHSLERSIGKWKFLAIYMITGLLSSLVSCGYHHFTQDYVVSAGASGAIYGLIGLMIVVTIKNRGRIGTSGMIYRLGILLVFVFYSNFVSSGVDVAAHIGGLIFGVIFGFIFLGGKKNARS